MPSNRTCANCRTASTRECRPFIIVKRVLLLYSFLFVIISGVAFQPACMQCPELVMGDVSLGQRCGTCTTGELVEWKVEVALALFIHFFGTLSIFSRNLGGCLFYMVVFTFWTAAICCSHVPYDIGLPWASIRTTKNPWIPMFFCITFDAMLIFFLRAIIVRRRARQSRESPRDAYKRILNAYKKLRRQANLEEANRVGQIAVTEAELNLPVLGDSPTDVKAN